MTKTSAKMYAYATDMQSQQRTAACAAAASLVLVLRTLSVSALGVLLILGVLLSSLLIMAALTRRIPPNERE